MQIAILPIVHRCLDSIESPSDLMRALLAE
jgi:hypothetical protein